MNQVRFLHPAQGYLERACGGHRAKGGVQGMVYLGRQMTSGPADLSPDSPRPTLFQRWHSLMRSIDHLTA